MLRFCEYTDIKDSQNRVLEKLTHSLHRLTEKLHIATFSVACYIAALKVQEQFSALNNDSLI